MSAAEVSCVVCGKPLKSAIGGESPWLTPADGMSFTSRGNYGSRLYDLVGDRYLQVVICDGCVAEAGRLGRAREGRPQPSPDDVFRPWTPGSEDEPWV